MCELRSSVTLITNKHEYMPEKATGHEQPLEIYYTLWSWTFKSSGDTDTLFSLRLREQSVWLEWLVTEVTFYPVC